MKKRVVLLVSLLSLSSIVLIGCNKKEKEIETQNTNTQNIQSNKEYEFVSNSNYNADFKLPTVRELKSDLNKYEFYNELEELVYDGSETDIETEGYFHIKDMPKEMDLRISAEFTPNKIDRIRLSIDNTNINVLEEEYIVDLFNAVFGENGNLYRNKVKDILTNGKEYICYYMPLTEETMVLDEEPISFSEYGKAQINMIKTSKDIGIEILNNVSEFEYALL